MENGNFTNLHSGLGQVDFNCHLFAHKDVGISSFAEQRLENVELGSSKRRPLSSLLSRVDTCNYKDECKELAFNVVHSVKN